MRRPRASVLPAQTGRRAGEPGELGFRVGLLYTRFASMPQALWAGAVLSACFEVVLARPSVNLNYHYATMGLCGSELRSLALPLRAGDSAQRLLADCLPTSPATA